MSLKEKIDTLDLVITALKEHERKLSEIVDTLSEFKDFYTQPFAKRHRLGGH